MTSPPATGGTRTLRVGVLTDLHLAPPGTAPTRWNGVVDRGRSRDLLDQALRWLVPRCDVLALLGDLSDGSADDDYRHLTGRLDATGLPAYVIPGNHDMPADGSGAWRGVAGGEGRVAVPSPSGVPRPPVLIGAAVLRTHSSHDLSGLGHPRGPGPLLWLTHFPVLSLHDAVAAAGWRYAGHADDRAAMAAHLRDHAGPVVVLAGHLHVRGHAISGRVLQLSQAALAEAPHDAAVVTVTTGSGHVHVDRHCHSVADSDADPLPVLDPPGIAFRWDGTRWAETERPTS